MNTLYLVRHGVAVPHGTPDIPDDERPLTPEGERKVRMVGMGLRRHKIKVDRIATSPLPRARRTAEIIAGLLRATDRLQVADELRAGCDADAVAEWIRAQADRRLMVVGHNPWVSEVLSLLTTGRRSPLYCDVRKAGVAALRTVEPAPAGVEGEGEAEAGDRPTHQVDWLARPRMFRR